MPMRFSPRFILFAGFSAAVFVHAGMAFALTDAPPSQPASATNASSASPPDAASKRPVKGLVPDQIYAVLVGEIAGRRGDMASAFTHYYRAAELTRSGQMAELAVRAAISAKDDVSAQRGIRLWLEIAPEASEVHQVAAFLRIKADDQAGALIHLERLIALSDAEAAFTKAAAIIARLPNLDQRVSMMESLVERYPDDADAQQSLAMLAASASRLEVADAAARRAMALRPDWNAPRLFLVRLLLSEGKRAEARQLLEGFVSASPEDQSLRMLYGQFLVEEEDFTSARDVFERMLRNQPKEPDVLFAVGILSLQLDDLEGAQIYFKRLFETGARADEATFYLGQTAERARDIPAALDWYAKVEGANADDARVRVALLRAKQGEIAPAREILQRLREGSPDNAIALFMVEAEILDEVGRQDDAMAVYETALRRFPGDHSLLYSRGLYAIKQGQIERGEQDLQRIIDADPNHADALNALGYTLTDRTDRHEEARELIERAHALRPDEPAILDSMGWVNYRLGRLDEARRYLEQALEQLDDGEIAAHLGEVLWALGHRAQAWVIWDKALAAHPEHAYLQAVISRHRMSSTESDAEPATPHGKDAR